MSRASFSRAAYDKQQPSPEQLRTVRAIEVLEHIGNPEARQLLEALARQPAETRLQQEAKAAAERLAKRFSPLP